MINGAPGFFSPRPFPPLNSTAEQSRSGQLLRHRAAEGDAGASGRFRSDQCQSRCASPSLATNVRTGAPAYFDNLEQKITRRACHGERVAAAEISADRNRWRILLGRRRRLEFADAIRHRRPAALHRAGFPGRSLGCQRRSAARHSVGQFAGAWKSTAPAASIFRSSNTKRRRNSAMRCRRFLDRAPEQCQNDPDVQFLSEQARVKVATVVQLKYQSQ